MLTGLVSRFSPKPGPSPLPSAGQPAIRRPRCSGSTRTAPYNNDVSSHASFVSWTEAALFACTGTFTAKQSKAKHVEVSRDRGDPGTVSPKSRIVCTTLSEIHEHDPANTTSGAIGNRHTRSYDLYAIHEITASSDHQPPCGAGRLPLSRPRHRHLSLLSQRPSIRDFLRRPVATHLCCPSSRVFVRSAILRELTTRLNQKTHKKHLLLNATLGRLSPDSDRLSQPQCFAKGKQRTNLRRGGNTPQPAPLEILILLHMPWTSAMLCDDLVLASQALHPAEQPEI